MFIPKPPPELPDADRQRHPSWYRYTRKYARKRRLVRDIWIFSGLFMILAPVEAIPVLALATTFLAFTILDETP